MKRYLFSAVLFCLLLLAPFAAFAGGPQPLRLGSGLSGGPYYQAGQSLAQVYNPAAQKTGYSIVVEPSQGSLANLRGLMSGKLQLGLAQADVIFRTLGGPAKAAQGVVRTVVPLYLEKVSCVASGASGIRQCQDLKGKRVALGPPDSGSRQSAVDALASCGLSLQDLAQDSQAGPNEAAQLLQAGQLDALFYTVGHPNMFFRRLAEGPAPIRFVPFKLTNKMRKAIPFYEQTYIWLDKYPGVLNRAMKVETFGVENFLLANASVPPEAVYAMFIQIKKNRNKIKRPYALASEMKNVALRERLRVFLRDKWSVGAPWHPGALKYYKEMGWLVNDQ
jgi:uncharacterized protein